MKGGKPELFFKLMERITSGKSQGAKMPHLVSNFIYIYIYAYKIHKIDITATHPTHLRDVIPVPGAKKGPSPDHDL